MTATPTRTNDEEVLPNENDPLIGQVGDTTYGSEHTDDGIHEARRRRPSLTESRRFEPLGVRIRDVIDKFWYLGFVAFGGPSAHVAILRDHLVLVNEWMNEDIFMELFALGQGLPGPSSTQLVISTAATHGGALGGVMAFIMWCLPGFTFLTICGMYLYDYVDPANPPVWLLGVPPAAMALIFKASYGFVQKLDIFGVGIGVFSCVVSIMINGDLRIPSNSSQIVYPALLIGGALATYIDFKRENSIGTYIKPKPGDEETPTQTAEDRKLSNKIGISVTQGVLYFLLWLGLLVGSIVLVNLGFDNEYLKLFEGFFRIGSLIFGGGVVMIPMAQSEFVEEKKWITDEQFFQGIGLAQAMPGKLVWCACGENLSFEILQTDTLLIVLSSSSKQYKRTNV